MADFFVQNLTNPVPSTHPAGVYISAPGIGEARVAFAELHPLVEDDVLYLVEVSRFNYYSVHNTPAFASEAPPALPANGT